MNSKTYMAALIGSLLLTLPSVGGATDLNCGATSTTNPTPGLHQTTVSSHTDDAFGVGRAFIEKHSLGLGKPKCDSDNCGIGQSCPAEGGSQITSGSVGWSWASPTTNVVTADVAEGTTTQQHCSDCS